MKLSKACLGIDIGSSYIKLVELRNKGRGSYQLISAHKIDTPDNCLQRSKITDEALLANKISQLLNNANTKTDRVVLGLNSSEVMLKSIAFPKMPQKELDKVLEFEFEDVFKLPSGQSVSDYSISYDILAETENEMNLLVAGCPMHLVTSYLNVLRQADLVPFIIDIGAFALPRVNETTRRSCYVDLGHSQTVIYIEIDGAYKVYRILPIGGAAITEGIMEAFETEVNHAENLKLNHDIDYLLMEGSGQKGLLRATIQQYVGGILQTLDYLRSQFRSSSINEVLDQVVICGGNAHIKGIDNLFKQELGMDVIVLEPFSRLQMIQTTPNDQSIYSTAIGLALRGLEAP